MGVGETLVKLLERLTRLDGQYRKQKVGHSKPRTHIGIVSDLQQLDANLAEREIAPVETLGN